MTALRHPNVVRSLVLSEPPALPLLDDHPEGEHVRDSFIAAVWEPAGQKLRQGEMEDGVRTFVDGLFGDGAFDQLPDPVHRLLMDNEWPWRWRGSAATARCCVGLIGGATSAVRSPAPGSSDRGSARRPGGHRSLGRSLAARLRDHGEPRRLRPIG
jgi:pimeloyl-ACP methyl ester carboxylesterase